MTVWVFVTLGRCWNSQNRSQGQITNPWDQKIYENYPMQWNPSLDKADIMYRQLAAESGYPWRNTKFMLSSVHFSSLPVVLVDFGHGPRIPGRLVLTNSFAFFIIGFVIIIIYVCIEFGNFSFNVFEFIFLVSLCLLKLSWFFFLTRPTSDTVPDERPVVTGPPKSFNKFLESINESRIFPLPENGPGSINKCAWDSEENSQKKQN